MLRVFLQLIRQGFVAGLGWSFGVTVGFVIISTAIVLLLKFLGGLPLIGNFLAGIVEETIIQLQQKTPVFR